MVLLAFHLQCSVSFHSSVLIIVFHFVGFINIAVVKHTKNVFSRSIKIASQKEIGKTEQIVILVQFVAIILKIHKVLQIVFKLRIVQKYLQRSERGIPR